MQVILDRSGSMSGGPWRQVQSAVTKMIEMTADNKRIFMKVMIYNDQVPKSKRDSKKRKRSLLPVQM